MTACSWCTEPLDNGLPVETDHIIPRVRGGPDEPWNRQRLHRRCNQTKGYQFTREALRLARRHNVMLIPDNVPADWQQRLSLTEDDEAGLTAIGIPPGEPLTELLARIPALVADDPETWLPRAIDLQQATTDAVNLTLFVAARLDVPPAPVAELARTWNVSRQAMLKRIYLGSETFRHLVT